MKRVHDIMFLVISFAFLASCNHQGRGESSGNVLARVYDMYLYESDIKDLVPKNTEREDSILMVKKFVNNWVMEMLILNKAKENLSEENTAKLIDQQVQDYRNSLVTHAYEKELVRQKLDTLVSEADIEKYYEGNKQNFELKDNIVKVLYIKVNRKAPNIEKVKQWYKSDDARDRASLEGYCHQFAENFYLDDSSWLLFDDLKKEIPIESYNEEMFLKNNRYVELQDSSAYYFVNIKGFMIKNSISPVSFERENIRTIIINMRKLELINKMKRDIYRDALSNKNFEILIR